MYYVASNWMLKQRCVVWVYRGTIVCRLVDVMYCSCVLWSYGLKLVLILEICYYCWEFIFFYVHIVPSIGEFLRRNAKFYWNFIDGTGCITYYIDFCFIGYINVVTAFILIGNVLLLLGWILFFTYEHEQCYHKRMHILVGAHAFSSNSILYPYREISNKQHTWLSHRIRYVKKHTYKQ